MYCRKCGKQINENAEYCSYCGVHNPANPPIAKQPATKVYNHATSKKRVSNRHIGIWIGTAALVIAIILAVCTAKQSNTGLTLEYAQSKMDAALESLYQEASIDNYIIQSLKGKVSITVDSIISTEDGCLAECTVTSVDFTTPILNYLMLLDSNAVGSYNNVVSELKQELSKAEEIQKTFHVQFAQTDNGYTVLFPEEMVVFCSGNIQELLPKLYEVLQGGTME